MTSFLDGPAVNVTALMLKRSPINLRVVFKPKGGPLLPGMDVLPDTPGEWDALDQPEDTPGRDEILFAYRIARRPGSVHINRGGGKGGFYTMAEYCLIDPQPDQETMRDKKRWVRWCEDNTPQDFAKTISEE